MQTRFKNLPVAVALSFLVTFMMLFLMDYLSGETIEKSIRGALPLSVFIPFLFILKVETYKPLALIFFSLLIGILGILTSLLVDVVLSLPLNWSLALGKGVAVFVGAVIGFLLYRAIKK